MKSEKTIKHSISEKPNFAARIDYDDQRGSTAVFYSNISTWDCNDDVLNQVEELVKIQLMFQRIAELGNQAELLWSRNS